MLFTPSPLSPLRLRKAPPPHLHHANHPPPPFPLPPSALPPPTWELVRCGVVFKSTASPTVSHKATVGRVQLLRVGGTSVPRDRRRGPHRHRHRRHPPPPHIRHYAPYHHPARVTTAPPLAFRSASLITALVSRLRRRQRALTGATRLQIPAPTFLMESASSGMFTFFPSFHPSGAPLTLQQG